MPRSSLLDRNTERDRQRSKRTLALNCMSSQMQVVNRALMVNFMDLELVVLCDFIMSSTKCIWTGDVDDYHSYSRHNFQQVNTSSRRQSQQINSRNSNRSQPLIADVANQSSGASISSADSDTRCLISTPAQVERLGFPGSSSSSLPVQDSGQQIVSSHFTETLLLQSFTTDVKQFIALPDKRKFNGSDFVSFNRYLKLENIILCDGVQKSIDETAGGTLQNYNQRRLGRRWEKELVQEEVKTRLKMADASRAFQAVTRKSWANRITWDCNI
ncbi:hypothetical protein MP228_003868 [Amoeboaphelidium protococcarum]|nr:hypothetical protein MP228_003868 [Amoeboaphelidium protococcarum]